MVGRRHALPPRRRPHRAARLTIPQTPPEPAKNKPMPWACTSFPLVPKVSAALWERAALAKLRFGGRGSGDSGALGVCVRPSGDRVSPRRASPKRCANFGNERKSHRRRRETARRGSLALADRPVQRRPTRPPSLTPPPSPSPRRVPPPPPPPPPPPTQPKKNNTQFLRGGGAPPRLTWGWVFLFGVGGGGGGGGGGGAGGGCG